MGTLSEVIPIVDKFATDEDDVCVECKKDVGAYGSVGHISDSFGLFYTPKGGEDGTYILAWCSRECILAWARKLVQAAG